VLGARPIRIENGNNRFFVSPTCDIAEIFFALALFFPVVAAFYINAFASARPVTLAIFFFALAFYFTSLRIFTDGRPMAAPTGAGFLLTLSFRQWLYTDYLN